MDIEQIIKELKEARKKDPFFSGGRIVSSVSTEPLRVALEAFRIFSDVNALDTYIFPSVIGLEREVIEWLGTMLKNPKAAGYITTGGTESNIQALYAAKKLYPQRKELIVPKSAHYSIYKAADLMGLRIKWTRVDGNFRADTLSIKKALGKDTLAVVATAGTAALGMVDPLEEINELCPDVFLHVDAAFGGFVLPFTGKRRMDFGLMNLDSVTIDPHKMGMTPIPAGSILFRDGSYLEKLACTPSYLPVETYTLCGSRSGGAIAASWAVLKSLGLEGYKKIVDGCMKNTAYLCSELEKIPGASLATEPDLNIVGIKIPDLEKNSRELGRRGWKLAVNTDAGCIRFVVMPHVTIEVIDDFMQELKKIIKNKG